MQSGNLNPEALTIIGMAVSWGGCETLDDFERMIYEGTQHFEFAEAPQVSFDDALTALDRVVNLALLDAGLTNMGSARLAVLFAADAPLRFHPAWAVLVEDLSDSALPLVSALDRARQLLASRTVDAVVFAAAGSEAGLEDPVSLQRADTSRAMGFDRDVHGWRLGNGAGAVVLSTLQADRNAGYRAYAALCGQASVLAPSSPSLKSALPQLPALEQVRSCCRMALEQSGVSPTEVGYVEVFASGSDNLDGVEIAGLCQVYRTSQPELTAALGSVQANLGYLFSAAGLAALLRTALCLYHRILPAVPAWTAPKLPALWRGAPFYAPTDSRTWFAREDGPGRVAAVSTLGLGGSFAHLVLAEVDSQANNPPEHSSAALASSGFHLFPLAADSLDDLLEQLQTLHSTLPYANDLFAAASKWHDHLRERHAAALAAAIVGHNHEELLREVELAIKSIPAAFDKGIEWQTPLGSCFTPQPVGRLGQLAFVYPGAFNSYPGVARDLFRLFPWLFNRSVGRTTDLGRVIRERQLYPRSLSAFGKEEQSALEAQLISNPVAMLTSGTTVAILFTYILQEAFKLQPSAAFGYSLGENSMMFASGVWQEGDQVTANLESSPLFHNRLAGPQNAIREYWGLPSCSQASSEPLWNNYLVMAPVETVQPLIDREPHVFLTHVNTPRQVVIGGDPASCQRIISTLRCSSLQAPFDYALHCAAIRSEFDSLARLHDWSVDRSPNLRMYSAAEYQPLRFDPPQVRRHEIARQIAHMLSSPLDFPRLVRQVYEDGARVFIEVGAGSNCARWVDETLKGSPHLALSVNRRGTEDVTSLVRLMARLHSHCISLDLSPLYRPQEERIRL